VAGHSAFAARIGMPPDTIAAIRDGRPLPDQRYQALVDFTRVLVRRRGQVTDDDMAALKAAGFGTEQVFEIIAGVALKTITNFVGNVFDLPLDVQFRAQAWSPDGDRKATRPKDAAAA
jgi:alkylhydroperoxidase family enzyme